MEIIKKLVLLVLCLIIAIPELSLTPDMPEQTQATTNNDDSTKEGSTFFRRIVSSTPVRIMVIGSILGFIAFQLRKKSVNRAKQPDNKVEDLETATEFQAKYEEALKRQEEKERACTVLEREIKVRRRQYSQFFATPPRLQSISKKNAKMDADLANLENTSNDEKKERKQSRIARYAQELEKLRAKTSSEGKKTREED